MIAICAPRVLGHDRAPRVIRSLIVVLAVLSLVGGALQINQVLAGGPTISAFYDFPSGYVHVNGSGFTPGGTVRVSISGHITPDRAGESKELAWGEELTVTATQASEGVVCFDAVNCVSIQRSAGGTFGLWSNRTYCRPYIHVVAVDEQTGAAASFWLHDTRCPE